MGLLWLTDYFLALQTSREAQNSPLSTEINLLRMRQRNCFQHKALHFRVKTEKKRDIITNHSSRGD